MSVADQQLTPNFWLSEFTRSEIAARMGIENTPSDEQLANLRRNAAGMELVKVALQGRPILISSGLRTEAVERVLCAVDYKAWCARHGKNVLEESWQEYFARKNHPLGLCTDFTAPRFGPPAYVARAVAATDIDFDQVIYEHTWVHVGWAREGARPRREVLTMMPGGAYALGILDKEKAA